MLHLIQLALLLAPAAGPEAPASVVRIANSHPDGSSEGGSGVVVRSTPGRSLIVTNKHVVASGGRLYTYAVGGWWGRARLVRYAPAGDLALLEVATELPAAELAPDVPARGAPLTLWGFSHGEEPCVKRGRALGYEGTIHRLPAFMTTVRSEDGDSGGGQFDDRGRLVCLSITSAGSTVPVTAVRELLGALK